MATNDRVSCFTRSLNILTVLPLHQSSKLMSLNWRMDDTWFDPTKMVQNSFDSKLNLSYNSTMTAANDRVNC